MIPCSGRWRVLITWLNTLQWCTAVYAWPLRSWVRILFVFLCCPVRWIGSLSSGALPYVTEQDFEIGKWAFLGRNGLWRTRVTWVDILNYVNVKMCGWVSQLPNPVAARSKACVSDRPHAVFTGSNSPWGIDVCVLSGRGICFGLITRLEESYRFWSWNPDSEKALAHWGAVAPW
jgi:hypothetical protein